MNTYGITSGTSTSGDVSKVIAEPLYMVRGGYVGSGTLWYAASSGYYWSSAVISAASACLLSFNSGGVYPLCNGSRAYGFAVRPVRRII